LADEVMDDGVGSGIVTGGVELSAKLEDFGLDL